MTRALLHCPTGSYSLRAPEEILRIASVLYPRSLELAPPSGAAAAPRRSLRVDRAGRAWRLTEDGRAVGVYEKPLHAALAVEYAVERAVARDCGDRIALHAGAVGVRGRAVLLAGRPDSGKTSTAFHLLEMGHALLAEEVTLIDSDSGTALPFPQTLSLDGRLLAEGRSLDGTTGGRLVALEPPHLYRYLPANVAADPLPVERVLLPRYSPGAAPRIEKLPPEDALTELLSLCYEPAGDAEALIDRVIRLTAIATVTRFIYPRAEAARDLLRRLLG